MEIRHILAPTDFSPYSTQAIEYAFALAQTFGAKLSLLYVIEMPAFPVEGTVLSQGGTTLLDDLKRDCNREMDRLLPDAEASQVEVARHVVVGKPYRTIVKIAEAKKADLIVMATRGRTGLSHLLMGSVAERVVRIAPCPVLTIRATE